MDAVSILALNPDIISQLRFSNAGGSLYVQVLEADKPRRATPEEVMRQITVAALLAQFGYPKHLVACEVVIQIGINRPRADIVVSNENGSTHIVLEVKAYHPKDAKHQLSSYMVASGAKFGAVVLRDKTECFTLENDRLLKPTPSLPNFGAADPIFSQSIIQRSPNDGLAIHPLDSIQRTSKTHLLLCAHGESVQMTNVDAATLSKVQKAFLQAGTPLSFRSTSASKWRETVSNFITEAAVKVTEDAKPHEYGAFLECLRSLDILGGFNLTLASAITMISESPKETASMAIRNHLLFRGVRVGPEAVFFGNTLAAELFTKTRYLSTWRSNLLNLPGADKNGNNTVRFMPTGSKCISVPLYLFMASSGIASENAA